VRCDLVARIGGWCRRLSGLGGKPRFLTGDTCPFKANAAVTAACGRGIEWRTGPNTMLPCATVVASQFGSTKWQSRPGALNHGRNVAGSCTIRPRSRRRVRAVFHLGLRQTEGLIGSIVRLLGLNLSIPDHSTLSKRAETLVLM
jgi:hypothetical protein